MRELGGRHKLDPAVTGVDGSRDLGWSPQKEYSMVRELRIVRGKSAKT